MKYSFLYISLLLLLVGCGVNHPAEPQQYNETSDIVWLYPDYTETTIPCNLAPINFMIDDATVEACIARIDYPGGSLTYGEGNKVVFDVQEWKRLIEATKGGSFQVTLYTKGNANLNPNLNANQWRKHPTFNVYVAEDEIDPWISYRLIEPSYVAYENIDIMERNLTSYEERIIASNHIDGRKEQCINCHSYQNYKTENMLFHVRGEGGGTMLIYHNQSKLMNALKREGMISNPVYPAWHPSKPLIAFSNNKTGQFFHTQSTAKIEVLDEESHLVLYDVERDSMFLLPSDPTEFDNFPTWSPDGRRLYYTSAHFQQADTSNTIMREMADNYMEIHYNLYCRDFDPETLQFGDQQLLLRLDSMKQSASLPRVSPDGKSLLYASGKFGCFHIWHYDADIRRLDLETMQIDSLEALNSPLADSYPTWSSNGRWITMASRRDDNNYSRIYISYFDAEGKAHKAFAVPQADPEHDKLLLRSYNRPETMVEPAPRLY